MSVVVLSTCHRVCVTMLPVLVLVAVRLWCWGWCLPYTALPENARIFFVLFILRGAIVVRTYRRHKTLPGIYYPFFTNNIRFYLLLSPVIV